jgi:hypothetical protein
MYVSRTRSRLGGYDTSSSMPHNTDLRRGCSDMSKSVRGRDSARSLACADGASVEVTRRPPGGGLRSCGDGELVDRVSACDADSPRARTSPCVRMIKT